MKTHVKQSIELDHLNLALETKTEVSDLIQSLLTQAQNELKLLEGKNQALTLELAHFAPHSLRREERSTVATTVEFVRRRLANRCFCR